MFQEKAIMIGIWGSHAQTFLLVFATKTTVFFALPIFFKPILWARAMLWNIPASSGTSDLTFKLSGAFRRPP
jgi:hypothetical protein